MTKHSPRLRRLGKKSQGFAALASFSLIGVLPLQSQIEWIGTDENNNFWDNPANWSGGVVPTIDDDIFIPASTTHINLSGQTVSVRSIQMEKSGSNILNGTLYVASGEIVKSSTSSGAFVSAQIQLGADATLSNAAGGGANVLALTSSVSDGGNGYSVTIDGGNVSLRGTNTFSGNLVLASGTLQLEGSAAFGTGDFIWESGLLRTSATNNISTDFFIEGGRRDWYLDSQSAFNRDQTFSGTINRTDNPSAAALDFRLSGQDGIWRFKEALNLGNVNTSGLYLQGNVNSAGQANTFVFSSNVNTDNWGITIAATGHGGSINLLIDEAISFDGMGRIVDNPSTVEGGRGATTIGGIHEEGRAIIAPRDHIILNNKTDAAINLVSLNEGAVTEFASLIQEGTTSPEVPVAVHINNSYQQVNVNETLGNNVVYETVNSVGIVDLSNSTGNTYRGGTIVHAGELRANNESGSATGTGGVLVHEGSRLAGAGIIAPDGTEGVTLQSGAVLAPGNDDIGTLRFDAANLSDSPMLTLEEGATISFKLGAPGTSDSIAFLNFSDGDFVLTDNVINFIDIGSLAPGEYTLFSFFSDDGITQTISGISEGLVIGSGLEQFEGSYIRYGEYSIDLIVIPEPSAWNLIGVASLLCVFVKIRRKR